MTTSSIQPSRKWAGTSILFSGGGTSLAHQANRAFTHGYALEHIIILIHPLPSYQ